MVVVVFLLGLLRQDALVENVVDQMLDRRLVGVFVVDRLARYGGAPRPHAELRELEHIARSGTEAPPPPVYLFTFLVLYRDPEWQNLG